MSGRKPSDNKLSITSFFSTVNSPFKVPHKRVIAIMPTGAFLAKIHDCRKMPDFCNGGSHGGGTEHGGSGGGSGGAGGIGTGGSVKHEHCMYYSIFTILVITIFYWIMYINGAVLDMGPMAVKIDMISKMYDNEG